MDLEAYANIENLDQIAKDNGIEIPRLRGYRLMGDEGPASKEEIFDMMKDVEVEITEKLCRAEPVWNPFSDSTTYSFQTDCIADYYLIKEDRSYVAVRWDRIHGRNRRILKFEIKKQKRKIKKQYDTWNKYAGREDVLYIHSRMGGYNWKEYNGKTSLINQSWFLDRVDDCWDGTYCDFYAKIN